MSQNENFENLFIALVNCFVFIISGYVVGRLNLITSNQAKGISKLTGLLIYFNNYMNILMKNFFIKFIYWLLVGIFVRVKFLLFKS